MSQAVVRRIQELLATVHEMPREIQGDDDHFAFFIANPGHHDGKRASFLEIDKAFIANLVKNAHVDLDGLIDSKLRLVLGILDDGFALTMMAKTGDTLRIHTVMISKEDLPALFGEKTGPMQAWYVEHGIALKYEDYERAIDTIGGVLPMVRESLGVRTIWSQYVPHASKHDSLVPAPGGTA